ncbi:type II secretion system protein [Mariprofundus erugo]|uniref:Type II secretion system protein n=1 Tax=Mariprofundus erugo TaxID=2528639 RepID=A0A5R9GUM8_9PROT|nr:type II secretion system protein [Mariprofundus erugo]TLS69188.1 type II secretion system protein [Mariprofundus erugo]TLS75022.1 type II secretion system protein [Mariprofundus erugo]
MRSARQAYGFTLIEMIGVLAIMSVFAAMVVPNLIKRLDISYADAETKTLNNLALDLEQYILTKRRIPSVAGGEVLVTPVGAVAGPWFQELAAQSALPPTKIQQNEKGINRIYYIDPGFFTLGGAFLGYDQNAAAVAAVPTFPIAAPNSPRIMIVSDLQPAAVARPAALTAAQFQAVWDQPQQGNPAAALPPIVEGDSVVIKRINLSYLFNHVLLQNNVNNVLAPSYRVEGQPVAAPILLPNAAAAMVPTDLYLMPGTRVSLYAEGAVPVLQQEFLVNGFASYRYDQVVAPVLNAAGAVVTPGQNAWFRN